MLRTIAPASLLSLVLLGCSGLGMSGANIDRLPNQVEAGTAVACLGSPQPGLAEAEPGELITFQGVVRHPDLPSEEMHDNVAGCQDEVDVVIAIADDRGRIWHLGWSWLMGWGWGGGVDLDTVEDGDEVEVSFRRGANGESAGFVVRRDGELALVLEAGLDGPGLEEEDLPGELTVTRGAWWAYDLTEDGELRDHFTIDFTSESDEVRVPPDGDDVVEVEEDSQTVCTIASWTSGQGEDVEASELSWVMF